MKIFVLLSNKDEREGSLKHSSAERVDVEGVCPSCGHTPFQVCGIGGKTVRRFDNIQQDAMCLECETVIGTVKAVFDTIFGLDEDERVLKGPQKVF